MLAIKIFPPSPSCFPSPTLKQSKQVDSWLRLLVLWSLVSIMSAFGGRSSKQNQSANLSYLRHFMWFIGSWTGAPYTPLLLKHPSLPRCSRYSPGVTKTFTSSWRLPLFVAVVVVVVADCGKTSYTSSVARLATGPAVVASSSRQIKIQIVTKLLVLWRSLIIVKRCGFACNCKCKSCLNCITIGDGFAMIQLWIDYTTKDCGNELDWAIGDSLITIS